MQVEFVKGSTRLDQLPQDRRPEVAFIGRSNVGKSSLLNKLVGRKALARVSRTPGKTQELNSYLVENTFYIVDVPGLGYAKVSKTQRERWARLIERYLNERESLRLVCHLVDSRHPPTALDKDIMAWMRGSHSAYLVALTKGDKLSGNGRAKSRREVEKTLTKMGLEVPIVVTSAETGLGKQDLWKWIRDVVR